MIDGSEIYTPKRAQNVLEPKDVDTLYNLYIDYIDVIEKCKIVTIADVETGNYELSVNKYIERRKQEAVSPAVVRMRYYAALQAVREAEDKMNRLLIEGGYVNEQEDYPG